MTTTAKGLTEEQKALAAKLTKMQRLVVIGVMEGKSQRQAYRDAGGKSKRDSVADAVVSRMLSDSKVRAFYDSLSETAASSSVMTRQEALERLTRSARVTIADIAEFREEVVGEDEDGNPVVQTQWRIKNSDEMTPEAAAAIKSVTATKFGPKLELHDSLNAIRQLRDMQGWDEPKRTEHTGANGGAIEITQVERVIV